MSRCRARPARHGVAYLGRCCGPVTAAEECQPVLRGGGAFGGAWKRTGQTFSVWPSQVNASASPTCHFFSTALAPKSSHFYTPFSAECASVKTEPAWEYESIAFYIQLADANGLCGAGTIPLYRAYNHGMGGAPNHRYTTSPTNLNPMIVAGWLFEGNGNTMIFAGVPAMMRTTPGPFNIRRRGMAS